VSNDADNSVHKLSPTGKDLGVFVSLIGIGCPDGLAFSGSGNLLVADICDSVIRQYSAAGEDLGIFASVGLSNPAYLAFDTTGNVFVSNTDNGGEFRNTIHEFSPSGQDLGVFASTGLRFPTGLVFDPVGNLLVANGEQRPGRTDYSIRKFSPKGEDLGDFAVLSDQPRELVISHTKSTTSTVLTSRLNPSTYGQTVMFIAAVTTTGLVAPIGTVSFTGTTNLVRFTIGTATVNSSGIATLARSNLNAGLYPLTAVYKGDANSLASTSTVLNQSVLQTTTKATITSSLNPSIVGQAVTFTAKITSPTVMPTGPVTFTLGATTLGTSQLSGGKATFSTSSLAAGSNAVKVTYLGNSNIAKSSAALIQVVQP